MPPASPTRPQRPRAGSGSASARTRCGTPTHCTTASSALALHAVAANCTAAGGCAAEGRRSAPARGHQLTRQAARGAAAALPGAPTLRTQARRAQAPLEALDFDLPSVDDLEVAAAAAAAALEALAVAPFGAAAASVSSASDSESEARPPQPALTVASSASDGGQQCLTCLQAASPSRHT